MNNQSFDDVSKAEIESIENNMIQTKEKMTILAEKHARLRVKYDGLEEDLDKARKQATNLKKFIWTSDDPNIATLRNEILLAAKLIKDN